MGLKDVGEKLGIDDDEVDIEFIEVTEEELNLKFNSDQNDDAKEDYQLARRQARLYSLAAEKVLTRALKTVSVDCSPRVMEGIASIFKVATAARKELLELHSDVRKIPQKTPEEVIDETETENNQGKGKKVTATLDEVIDSLQKVNRTESEIFDKEEIEEYSMDIDDDFFDEFEDDEDEK